MKPPTRKKAIDLFEQEYEARKKAHLKALNRLYDYWEKLSPELGGFVKIDGKAALISSYDLRLYTLQLEPLNSNDDIGSGPGNFLLLDFKDKP